MKIKLSDIKITKAFEKTHPNPNKLLQCMTYYAKYGKLDRDIVLTKDNILVDGYVGYLTLMRLGIKKWKCIKDDAYQWYVQGKHNNNEKTYTWKLPKALINDGSPVLRTGRKYAVETSNGAGLVKIVRIFLSKNPPISGDILEFTLV